MSSEQAGTENNKPGQRLLFGAFMPLVSGLLAFGGAFMLAFSIACEVSPPYVTDPETDEKHVVMVMGQAFLALLIAIVAGIAVCLLARRYFLKKIKR